MSNLSFQLLYRFWALPILSLLLLGLALVDSAAPVAQASPFDLSPQSGSLSAANRPARQGEAEWTIMLYQDADDEVLEQDIMIDFNEAERIGSTDQVNLVAQVDRFEGAFDGMGDWTSTKRFYITQDDDMNNIGSEELADLGEINMADSETLVDFIAWSVENFPARKYALILSDHGAGWPGGFGDPDPGGPGPDNLVLQEMFGDDQMWLMELDKALEEARAQTGIEQFEFIGFDACLMSQLEVFNAIVPHGLYSVASQETEPSLGWAYTSFLGELADNPQMDGAELAQLIVETYIDQDQRIVDDATRQQFLTDMGADGGVSPEALAADLGRNITLTAVDLAAIPAVNAAVDNLAATLVSVDPQAVAEARAYAQPFESVFGEESPSPYIDLGHFAQLVVELTGDEQVAAAADELFASLNQAILAEKHGPDRPGATGLTIHFPTSDLFGTADNLGYATVAGRFAGESRWDEFLAAFHGGGATFSRPDEPALEPAAPEVSIDLSEEDWATIEGDVAYLQELGYTLEEIPQVLVDQGGYPPDLVQALVEAGYFAAQPASRAASRSAAPKPIQLAPLTLSAELARPEKPVNIQSEVSGDRLAYLYTFIGRFLPRQDVLLIEDKDYLFADESKEVNGVKYPVWPDGAFTIDFDWEPTVYAVSDGKTSLKALIEPESYDADLPTYSVGATYQPVSGGDLRFAKIYFRDGEMTEIFGFTSGITQSVGAPRQILPQPGDKFILLERGDDLSQAGEAGLESYVHEGGTLTFSGQPF
ncbi:MAG: clostripain-related cysteine peptidase, partial [Chloroflexota bacterium]